MFLVLNGAVWNKIWTLYNDWNGDPLIWKGKVSVLGRLSDSYTDSMTYVITNLTRQMAILDPIIIPDVLSFEKKKSLGKNLKLQSSPKYNVMQIGCAYTLK